MKRSEVVNYLSDQFYYCGIEPEDAAIKAEKVLNELEKMGMLPPKSTYNINIYGKGVIEEDCNEWEPEDE